jgi:nicotinic acid mononucleotide adenylyltransferase
LHGLILHCSNNLVKARSATADELTGLKYRYREVLAFDLSDDETGMQPWTTLLAALPLTEASALLQLMGDRFPCAEGYHLLQALCPEIVFQDEAREWVFYGGSFEPWHEGHQACLNLLPEEKTCLVLPDRNPLKPQSKVDPVSVVINLCSEIQLKPRQYFAPSFLNQSVPNPTVVWIERLATDFPGQQLSLLMGFDSFASIQKWVRYQDLLNRLTTIYLVARKESDQEREDWISNMKTLAPRLKIVFLGRHDFEEKSSTAIRQQAKD